MGRLTSVSVAVAVGLLMTATAAQERPDFSGSWSAPSPPAPAFTRGPSNRPPGTMGSGWGPDITVTHDTNRLTVERVFFARGDLQPALKFRYALDGSDSLNSVLMGHGTQEQVSEARWDGDRLVITTRHSFSNPADGHIMLSEMTQTLSLETSTSLVRPPTLVVEATRSGVLGGPSSTTRTVYTKR